MRYLNMLFGQFALRVCHLSCNKKNMCYADSAPYLAVLPSDALLAAVPGYLAVWLRYTPTTLAYYPRLLRLKPWV